MENQEIEKLLNKIVSEIKEAQKVDYQRNRKTYDKCIEIVNKHKLT